MSDEVSLVENTQPNGVMIAEDTFDIIRDLHDKVSMEDT
jgi:hypothetical protein